MRRQWNVLRMLRDDLFWLDISGGEKQRSSRMYQVRAANDVMIVLRILL